MASYTVERRNALRVEANLKLSVKLHQPDGTETDSDLETINISTSGVYFKSDHFIEPMTKLAMGLEVAVPSGSTEEPTETALVSCEGLVVRVIPEQPEDDAEHYEVAVFFTHIEPDGVDALERHIAMLIES
jgi:hypothetical protein